MSLDSTNGQKWTLEKPGNTLHCCMDTAFVGYLVHLETAKHYFLETSTLFEKNSNLPTPKNSCKSKMGRGNRRSSLSYSGAHDGTINTRTPKNQEEGRKCGKLRFFHIHYRVCPVKPTQFLTKDFYKIHISFIVLVTKIHKKKWVGHKSLLQRIQWRCGGYRTKDIPNSPSPKPEDHRAGGRFKGDVLCISIQTAETGNPPASQVWEGYSWQVCTERAVQNWLLVSLHSIRNNGVSSLQNPTAVG